MKLAIFNGSPRQKKSNSTILINQFLEGYNDHTPINTNILYLADISKLPENIEAFKEADTIIIIFPLYTDMMPGQVKFFIESVEHIDSKGKNIGFIIQSGFPESYQSIFIERYLIKLSKIMEWNLIGTVIKAGVEGIQVMPSLMTKKLFNNFRELGRYFASTGKFNSDIVAKLRKPYRFNTFQLSKMKLASSLGLNDLYWNNILKSNGVFDTRFDKPYI